MARAVVVLALLAFGTPVPFGTVTRGTMTLATTTLAPNTTYVVGLTLSGSEPFYARTFTTGTAIDAQPPAFAGLEGFAVESQDFPTEGCGAACVIIEDERVSRIRLQHAPVSDATRFELALRRAGESEPFSILALPADYSPIFGWMRCGTVAPKLERGVTYCGRLTAFDGAGNPAGDGIELCSETASCAADDDMCRPSDTCTSPSDSGCAVRRGNGGSWLFAVAVALLLWRRGRR
jgi:hypothetical protein